MLKNYFKIAWRSLLKNMGYSAINVVGLALGMAVAILIGLWIWDEVTFDDYHQNKSRLGQVMGTLTFSGQSSTGPSIVMPLADELRNKYSGDFKQVALSSWTTENILAAGETNISETGNWAEEEFPDMLSLKMLKGSRNALHDPSSILIAASVSKALFGNADPMNKVIRINNKFDLKVAGVYQDLPASTTLYTIHYFLPWKKFMMESDWVRRNQTAWNEYSFQIYVQLSTNADFDKINAKVKNLIKLHSKDGNPQVFIHPMEKWHLYSEFVNGKAAGGRIQFVWLFGIIGVFVLLLACINFMNLSTARSEKRAKEVGVRKAIGSMKRQLITQFLTESLMMAVLAFVIAIILVLVFLPVFNHIASKQIQLPWQKSLFWLLCMLFTVFTGLIAGSYPAFYLSAFKPVAVLKGTYKSGRFSGLPRKVLVVVQFTVSVVLIIGTIVVFRQIQFAKNRPVGYSREGLITTAINTPDLYGHYDALRSDLLATGVVANMAESSGPTTDIWSNQIDFDWSGKSPGSKPAFGVTAVTHDFGKTIGWQIKKGRDFSRVFATDTSGLILNEAAAKIMGFKNPVGEVVQWQHKPYHIIGVAQDMIMRSPYLSMQPVIFTLSYGWSNVVTMRIKPGVSMRQAIAHIESVFKKYNPGSPFSYKFTDQEYAAKFSDEERIGNLASFFAVLAIFISSLGLLGLASYVAEQRTKEIGMRKVLGASVYNLWLMLSTDFVLLVVISCGIAIPIAWHFLSNWLQRYEYHTTISWWIFAAASLGAMFITLFTVSFQSVKAAIANPVKSLKME